MKKGMIRINKLVKTRCLIDGTGQEPLENGYILLDGEKIIETGSLNDSVNLPADVEIIDLSNYYLLPGLIDCHTHLSINPEKGNQLAQMRMPATNNILRSIPNIYKCINSGVTTMRVMGEEYYIDIDVREAIERGLIYGPRLLVSGIGLVASNGHGVAHTTTDGREEVRKLARQNLARGADLIKMFMTGGVSSEGSSLDFCGYTAKEVAVAVEEATRAGKYVAAHAHGGRGLDLCIQEGVRTLEHAAFTDEKQLEQIIEKDLWIVGTFSILFHPEGIEKNDFSSPIIRDKVLKARKKVAENFNMIIESGANLVVGTDSMHGKIAYELECLGRFGAGNIQAIQAVTKNAARACQIEDKLGTLEKGKLADFIALRENPLDDLKNMETVEHVYKGGKEVKINI